MSTSEIEPLLRQSSTTSTILSSLFQKEKRDLVKNCCWPKNVCLPSKSAILIILWSTIVGTVYTFIISGIVAGSLANADIDIVLLGSILPALLAVIMTLYPISGFIADVCCGRFKTVIVSVYLILFSLVAFCCIALITIIEQVGVHFTFHKIVYEEGALVCVIIFFVVFSVLFIVGLAGYQANFIQLGLDQLLEAPSEYLGLFTHWATWALNISSTLFITIMSLYWCLSKHHSFTLSKVSLSIPFVLLLALLVLVLVTHWKRRWFYSEPGQYNPYRTVFKVLNFARKHKHPLRRSAFTYSDNYIPSRLDFAKERYGGPFTTEQVENVKTLLRLLLLLFSLGPTYVLEVPASLYFFAQFGRHIGSNYVHHLQHHCITKQLWTVVVENGGLTAISSNILIPVYIWCVFSVFRRKLPKMFTRLKLGIVLCLLGVVSMLVTDLARHSIAASADHATNKTELMCMFKMIKTNYTLEYEPLEMNWSVLILPSVFFGVGPLIVTATTLEFISAQSPHSMKGLLVGVSFAVRGFSQLIGYLFIIPLSLAHHWTGERGSSVVSCGFIYLLISSIIGLSGLVFFSVIARKYKYRERDDENFSQKEVEEVYSRYLSQAVNINSSTSTRDNESDLDFRSNSLSAAN